MTSALVTATQAPWAPPTRLHRRVLLPLLLAAQLWSGDAGAAELDPPDGRVILRVNGAIEQRNDGDDAVFDLAMLEAIPQVTVRTETPWTDGVTTFEGPRVRDVLARVGASGTSVKAVALNDYQVTIPVADFADADVILALRRDGLPMGVRDRGPIWIIYPWSDRPELRDEVHHGRSIWQLKALTVE